MIWLTWRQNRARFLSGLAAVGVFALWLTRLGFSMRSTYDHDVAGCLAAEACDRAAAESLFVSSYEAQVLLCSVLVMVTPLLFGMFWGAPLVAQEHEAGTDQLVWTQSVSRSRWLATKLIVVVALGVVATGTLSLLLTWAVSHHDELTGARFGASAFASRNLAPLGHTVFALTLGVLVGQLLRRVVPAMALALAVSVTVGVLLPTTIRPRLQTPVTAEVAYTAEFRRTNDSGLLMQRDDSEPVVVPDYSIPGALMITSELPLRTASGEYLLSGQVARCAEQEIPIERCLSDLDLHLAVRYQPSDRYWTFQWLETGLLTACGLAMATASWWLIRR